MQRSVHSPLAIALTVLAYVATTFAVQGASHFSVNAAHYAGVTMMRPEPVIALGIAAMVIQGLIFAMLFPLVVNAGRPIRSGISFAWTIGAFLTSYIALGEAGKYTVPSIASWIAVEVSVALVQFTLFGALLGLVHRKASPVSSRHISV